MFKEFGLDCAQGKVATREEILSGVALLNYPYVLKEEDGGSSLNTFLINEDSIKFNEATCHFETVALAEEYIPG